MITNLGLALGAMRTVKNIPSKQMAWEIGIAESVLTRIIHGTSMPDAKNFVKIVKWLAEERTGVVKL